jgi:hypothetical protein
MSTASSANPDAVIKHSPLRHRPNEAGLATCALQGRHKTNSDDPGTKLPEKFLRMFLCRPGTLVLSFRTFHPRLSRTVAQSDIRCHTAPTTCPAPVSQPPAILPPCRVARKTCQSARPAVHNKFHPPLRVNISVDRRKATAHQREPRKSSRTKCGIGASLPKLKR